MTGSIANRFVAVSWLALACCVSLSHGWFVMPTTRHYHRQTWIRARHDKRSATTTTTLFDSKQVDNDDDESANSHSLIQKEAVRFLGKGANAIVRPGCVLVAPKHEFHHYYRRSAILIYAMGEAEDDSGDYLIRGLILDHPTPFTLKEMMDHQPAVVANPLGDNFLFRGGDKGGDGVILLHPRPDFDVPQIGLSGLYQGGWQRALEWCNNNNNINNGAQQQPPPPPQDTEDFKAFFNYCEFTENELEDLLHSDEDGDAWVSLEVPAQFCLNPDFDRGDAWSLLRNTIQQLESPEGQQQQQQQPKKP